MGWRVVTKTLHVYVSGGAGNANCHKNRSATTAADYHIIVGWSVVAKATENFYLICNHIPMMLKGRE